MPCLVARISGAFNNQCLVVLSRVAVNAITAFVPCSAHTDKPSRISQYLCLDVCLRHVQTPCWGTSRTHTFLSHSLLCQRAGACRLDGSTTSFQQNSWMSLETSLPDNLDTITMARGKADRDGICNTLCKGIMLKCQLHAEGQR